MKKTIVIVVALIGIAAALFFAIRPKETPSTGTPASAPSDPTSPSRQPSPIPGAPATAPSTRQAGTTPQPKPIPKEFQDPRALDPIPLTLNLGGPPFERQKDGRIFKTDVVNSLSDLNDENRDPVEDLQMLTSVVDAYRTIFKENPVAGENHEVVAALTGKNVYELALIDPAHPAINAGGELVDRWGTPFRFHPVSSQLPMEISSAGPDAEFSTPDDVMLDEPMTIGPPEPEIDLEDGS